MDLWGKEKDEIAIERIKTFCPPEGYAVAFSGGKDSIVSLDLVKRSGCIHTASYNVTGIDPPELVWFIKEHYPEVKFIRPKKTMWRLIVENGCAPTRLQRWCCRELKEGSLLGRTIVDGIRWEESTRRGKRKMVEPCFRDERTFYVHPIIDWSSQDIWAYIRGQELAYPSLYDEGWKRIGCILCPMNRNRASEVKRWPRYYRLYLKAFDKCIRVRREKGLKTTWDTGDDMMRWWLNDNRRYKDDPDQTVMFE